MRWSIVARCVAVDRLCAQFVGRCVHKVIRTRWENLYEDHSEKLWGDRLSCASCTTTTQQDAKLSCTTQWDWWVEKIFQWSARCKRIAFDFIRLWNYELSDLQSTVTVKQTPPPPQLNRNNQPPTYITWLIHYLFSLGSLSTNTAGKLNVFWHDSDTLGVDGTQVGIFVKTNEVRFCRFL